MRGKVDVECQIELGFGKRMIGEPSVKAVVRIGRREAQVLVDEAKEGRLVHRFLCRQELFVFTPLGILTGFTALASLCWLPTWNKLSPKKISLKHQFSVFPQSPGPMTVISQLKSAMSPARHSVVPSTLRCSFYCHS